MEHLISPLTGPYIQDPEILRQKLLLTGMSILRCLNSLSLLMLNHQLRHMKLLMDILFVIPMAMKIRVRDGLMLQESVTEVLMVLQLSMMPNMVTMFMEMICVYPSSVPLSMLFITQEHSIKKQNIIGWTREYKFSVCYWFLIRIHGGKAT